MKGGCRVIFRNLKLGGIGKFWGGGVNMREAQIYIKLKKKLQMSGRFRLSTRGHIPPRGVSVYISLGGP